MTELVLNTNTLPEPLLRMIPTEKVRVRETDGEIRLTPMRENVDCTIGLRGMFAGDPNMTVEKFLERKRADEELEQ